MSGDYLSTYEVTTNWTLVNRCREQLKWINSLPSGCLDEFSEDIGLHYLNNKQTDEEFARKVAMKEELETIVQSYNQEGKLGWRFNIFITGSTITHLAARNSDVDLCLNIPDAYPEDKTEREASIQLLQIIRHMLVNAKVSGFEISIKEMELVKATIPVIKFVTHDGLEGDLSVCVDRFVSGAHNSFFLRAFTIVDDRFAPLCMFIKDWATQVGVKRPGPPHHAFNSYALVMLVVHFLQCGVSPPILPNLQACYPGVFAGDGEFPLRLDFDAMIPKLHHSENSSSLGELFIGFLQYYKNFSFDTNFISIRRASTMDRRRVEVPSKWRESIVFIEDPMDDHNPGRTVKKMNYIKDAITRTLSLFEPAASGAEGASFPTVKDFLSMRRE